MADPREEVLVALRALKAGRERYEDAERREVVRARKLGLSWRAIAQALGRTSSAVHEKYSDDPEL